MSRNILKLIKTGLVLIYIGLFISCNPREAAVEYPQVIIDNNLEEYYEKAKWDLYKMNSLEMGRVDYLLELDSLLNKEIYIRDTLIGVSRLNRELVKDEAEMKRRFPNRFHYYIECDLEFFEFGNSPVIRGDTVELTFFPRFKGQGNIYKLSGGNIHTIEYVKGKTISYKRDDLGTGFINEEELLEMEKEFKDYLLNKKSLNFSSWLIEELKIKQLQY